MMTAPKTTRPGIRRLPRRICTLLTMVLLLALVPLPPAAHAGEIAWTFDSSVPPTYAAYVDDLLTTIYPQIITLYGEPSYTHTITIQHDPAVIGGYYDPQSDRITLGDLPNGGLGSTAPDPGWDYFLAHEFTHAFHGGYYFHSWIEEGMTEATNQLLTQRLKALGLRDLAGSFDFRRAVRWYDTFANMGPQVLGGVDWSPYYADWWSAAESYTALFTILAISQVAGDLWDWPRYQAFSSLNQALYVAEPSSVIIPEHEFFTLVNQTLTQTIDDQSAEDWCADQAIAARPAMEGHHLGVYASRFLLQHDTPVNPNQLVFFAFTWGPDPTYPTLISQLRVEDSTEVRLKIFDMDQKEVFSGAAPLLTQTPYYPNGNSLTLPDTLSWPRGAYRIEAEAEVGGVRITASNTFLAGVPDIKDAEDGVGVITLDETGRLTDTPWDSPDCDVAFQERGALLLTLRRLDTLPASCTLISTADPLLKHTITVPLPATRIVTLTGPARSTVMDQGTTRDGGAGEHQDGSRSSDAPIDTTSSAPEPGESSTGCAHVRGSSPTPDVAGIALLLLLLLSTRRRHTSSR